MNPYEVLCVERDANEKTIKAAYRELARKWHPDSLKDEEAIQHAKKKMQEINEAFDILKDPEKRAKYDKEHPINIYSYYAKKSHNTTQKAESSPDIEQEKMRQSILQFLNVEYVHKDEILEMFQELATGVLENAFAEEDYFDTLSLILEEQKECISKIQKIVEVAKKKKVKGLEAVFIKAQSVIDELVSKEAETPKSLDQAHYKEETKRLTEKIHTLMNTLGERVKSVTEFNLLNKTWEFRNDHQLQSTIKSQNRLVSKLLEDIQWIQKTATSRNIEIGTVSIPETSYWKKEVSIEECKKRVMNCKNILNMNLQELREEFWKKKCVYYKTPGGKTIFKGFSEIFAHYKGTFIVPPYVNGIEDDAFYWLDNIQTISIPAHLIDSFSRIRLPSSSSLKTLIFTYGNNGETSKTVSIAKIGADTLTRKYKYICIYGNYSGKTFALIDEHHIYVYDDKKIFRLSGVNSQDELQEISPLWSSYSKWNGYQWQIHTWAQVAKKLPNPEFMQNFPPFAESIRKWLALEKTNFYHAYATAEESLKPRVLRLYLALGALNGDVCYKQAEELISQLDVSTMYRSRLERFPNEKFENEDPMFCVPKSAVDLVQKNLHKQGFLPYVFAFLEGYQLFYAEAKKENTQLSDVFIMLTAPQYIFHEKVRNTTNFVKQLLSVEKTIYKRIADYILRLYKMQKRYPNKYIKKTIDMDTHATMHYRFLDLKELDSYLMFKDAFMVKDPSKKSNYYYSVEAENVFLSPDCHAIEIVDSKNNQIAIVILNLFGLGELFADIMECENKSVEVLEAIRRALIDQKNCNSAVTSISIGMNEAPRTTRYNQWRPVVENATVDWLKNCTWMKFEYRFTCRILGTSKKAYRVRFMVDGRGQYFDLPHPWDDPKKSRNRRRFYY